MPAGFEVYSEGGKLQISSEMLGFFCRRSGSGATASSKFGNTVRSQISVDVNGIASPIVAIRMLGYAAAFAAAREGQFQFATNAPIGTYFEFFVFDVSSSLPARAHGTGLEVYNGAGQVTFSSTAHPLRALARDTSYTRPHGGVVLATASLSFAGHSRPEDFLCYSGNGPTLWSWGESCPDMRVRLDAKLYGAGVSADGNHASPVEVSWDDVQGGIGSVSESDTFEATMARLSWQVAGSTFTVDVTGIPVGQTFF